MKILLTILFTVLLTSCIPPLPPCEGTEEQIYRCENLRVQKEQLRINKFRAIQENNRQWNELYKPRPYGTRTGYGY